jgi:hypothetical protein
MQSLSGIFAKAGKSITSEKERTHAGIRRQKKLSDWKKRIREKAQGRKKGPSVSATKKN